MNITIDNKKYDIVNIISYNNKDYIAYSDDNNTYISEIAFINNKYVIKDIDDNLLEKIKHEMENENES